MRDDIAIRVKNLSKCYEIYATPRDRLRQFVLPPLQRLTGRPQRQYFNKFWALQDVSFEVRKGETVGIIGRNGSGKSTLLQMICGTLTPSSGSIQTHGRIAALLELGSGFNPEFTGRENVYLNGAVLGLMQAEIDARFEEIVKFADIGDFIEQPVKTYSSGMMVRLAFAVVAHVDADILVVDEALSVGDAFFTQKCMRFLRNFMKTGTVLFVSHDTGAIVNLCNKAFLLDHGQIAKVGTPKEVIEIYLAKLCEANQDVAGVLADEPKMASSLVDTQIQYHDMRASRTNASTLRNDFEVFRFNPDHTEFGTGNARILTVQLLDKEGIPLSWVAGGEDVILNIRCLAYKDILRPIIGFQFKDRLGQVIFSDNTFLVYQHNPQPVSQDSEFSARFEFQMPVLPSGDYSISPAVAEGSQENHVQHHWIHDALIIKVHASSTTLGLISIPMKNINFTIE